MREDHSVEIPRKQALERRAACGAIFKTELPVRGHSRSAVHASETSDHTREQRAVMPEVLAEISHDERATSSMKEYGLLHDVASAHDELLEYAAPGVWRRVGQPFGKAELRPLFGEIGRHIEPRFRVRVNCAAEKEMLQLVRRYDMPHRSERIELNS